MPAALSSAENLELSPPDPFMSLQWPRQPCCRNLVEKGNASGRTEYAHQGTLARCINGRKALYISVRSPFSSGLHLLQSGIPQLILEASLKIRLNCFGVIPSTTIRLSGACCFGLSPVNHSSGWIQTVLVGRPKVRLPRTARTVALSSLGYPNITGAFCRR